MRLNRIVRRMLKIIYVASEIIKQFGTKIIKYEISVYHISKKTLTSAAATLMIKLTEVSAKRVHKDLIL